MTRLIQRIRNSENKFLLTLMHAKNYLSANLATKALGFLSIPILTRLLSPEDYGMVGVFNSYVGIFVVLFTFNIHEAIGRYYYENKDDNKDFIGNSLIFICIFTGLSFIPFVIYNDWISEILNLPKSLVILFIPSSIVLIFWSVFIQIKSPRLKTKEIAILSVVKTYAGFGMTVFLAINLSENRFRAPIYSGIITGFIVSIYILISIRKYVRFSISINHLTYSVKYAFPLIPYTLSGVILAQFDRIMINSIVGTSQAGLYSFAYSIGMLSDIVASSLNAAWMPSYFKYMDEKRYKEHDKDLSRMIRIVLILAFVLVCFAHEIGIILAKKNFHEALSAVPIIVIGYVFYFFATIYIRNIAYKKKTIYLTLIMLSAGILNIVLNSLLIPKYGYMAGAWTTLLSYLFLAILSWILSKYILKVYTLRLSVIFKPFFIFLFFLMLFILVKYQQTTLLVEITLKLFLCLNLFMIFRKMKISIF